MLTTTKAPSTKTQLIAAIKNETISDIEVVQISDKSDISSLTDTAKRMLNSKNKPITGVLLR